MYTFIYKYIYYNNILKVTALDMFQKDWVDSPLALNFVVTMYSLIDIQYERNKT